MKKSTIMATFTSDVEDVWRIVTDNSVFDWRSDLSKIEVLDETKFYEISKDGYKTEFEIVEKNPLSYYAFELKNKNMTGKWYGKFSKLENGTQIEFTEEIKPINPIMNLLLGFYLKKQQSLYISDLKKVLGE